MTNSKLSSARVSSARPRMFHLETLEDRRMLAGDVAGVDELSAMVAADVNADGRVSAVDALQVINQLNAASEPDVVTHRLDVNEDGRVSAADALRIINRLNLPQGAVGESGEVIDVAMELVPSSRRDAMRGVVQNFLGGMNELRSRIDLPSGTLGNLVGNVIDVVRQAELPSAESVDQLASLWQSSLADGDLTEPETESLVDQLGEVIRSTGATTEQVDAIFDDVDTIISAAEIDRNQTRSLLAHLDRIVTTLLESGDQDQTVLNDDLLNQVVSGLVGLGSRPLAIGPMLALAGRLQQLQPDLSLPTWSSVNTFISEYVRARADGDISSTELTDLSSRADEVLLSTGLNPRIRGVLIQRFESLLA